MARIQNTNTYIKDTNVSDNDIVIGSDYENSFLTKNFRLKDIKDYILNGISFDPFPFKIYSAQISQTGTSNPSVYLENYNTLNSTISFSRIGVGVYAVAISGSYDFSNCFYNITSNHLDKADNVYITIKKTSNTVLTINTFKSNVLADGTLNQTPLKIEVYPVV